MPIKEYLHGHQFSPEVIQLMGVAFEMARASNKLLDRPDITDALIGKQIVALASAGERSIDQLCDRALALVCALPPSVTSRPSPRQIGRFIGKDRWP